MDIITRDKVTKGTLGGRKFLYNPQTFTDTIAVTYNSIKTCGMSYPAFVYGGGEPRSISFTIYLNDQVEVGVTRSFISHLHTFLPPARKKGYQFVAPRPLIFSFGWFVKECHLQNMDINYLAFSPQLQPIEAEVTVTLLIIQ